MATTPILTMLDSLVTRISTQWGPTGNDAVSRVYQTPVKTSEIVGRKVYLFPAEYDDESATRAEDLITYRVAIIVAERYEAAGEPTVAWVDTRVDFVNDLLDWLEFLGTSGNPLHAIGTREIKTLSREPVQVYDVEMLVKHKMFWSELEFTFQELA